MADGSLDGHRPPLILLGPGLATVATLADMVNLDDPDGAVDDLFDMSEADYDRAVLAYVIDHRPGEEIMRDLALIERLYDALTRVRDRLRSMFRNDNDRASKDDLGRLLRAIEVERRAIRADAVAQKDIRVARERTVAETHLAEAEGAKLRVRLDEVRRLREQLSAVERKTPTQRAHEELARRHLPEFLQLKREERDKDRQNGQGQAGISAVEPVAEPAQRQRRRGGGYSSQIATA